MMNGNDIAKLLEVDSWYKLITREEIAYVLRKQQDEIEALQAENKFFKDLMGDVEILRKVSEA
jgi:hypothetical protein